MPDATLELLQQHGIRPSAQRLAVAQSVLTPGQHPSADEVWTAVRRRLPVLSRATVYNTLDLFVAKGLLRPVLLAGGRVVFDATLAAHHHLIDDETGVIHDVPWEALRVLDVDALAGFDVREYQVVLRGRRIPIDGP
jgi:Fur family iron response transcriptional regulator